MQDLYKAIDSLRKINESPYQEVQLDEKLTPFKGSYNKKTQKLVNFTMKNGERKTFVAPIDYEKPLSKTNPSLKKILDKFKSNDKKVSIDKQKTDTSKFLDKSPSVNKPVEKPPMDIMGAGTKNKDVDAPRKKVKATAANTKDYEKTLRLQKRLIAKGADIKADGIMGPNTRAAMQKFMKPGAMPTPRPTPKSGGPDKRFITGPELDMPNMKPNNPMAPPEKKISQKNSPGNPFSPDKKIKPQIDRRLTPDLNRYVADKGGNYKPKLAPAPAPNDDNKSFLDRIKNYKLGDLSRGIRDFAVNLNKNRIKNRDMVKKMDKGINPNKIDPKFAGNTKIQTQSKQPTKTMIEQITGKKTCL